MPRVSLSTDYLFENVCRSFDFQTSVNSTANLSPNDIDQILSKKLYDQIKSNSISEEDLSTTTTTDTFIDPELVVLVDRFFDLTYSNTIPMVNLLATAVATNFLKENIRQLDNKLKDQQAANIYMTIKRGTSLLNYCENEDGDDDDDGNLSWASAPT